jgi:hypothetical protein
VCSQSFNLDISVVVHILLCPQSRDRCYGFQNVFAEKYGKNIGFFAQTTVTFCKNLIVTLVFEKNANFFAENWQKSPKIVIITSTPGSFFECEHLR